MTAEVTGPANGVKRRPPGAGRAVRLRAGWLVGSALLAGLLAAPQAGATEIPDNASEYEVKAAYLLNFARFVEWPAGAFKNDASAITVGIVGPEPLDRQIEHAMEERVVQDRPIRVAWLRDPEEATSCHIVFLPGADADPRGILTATAGKPVLTVAESDSFAAQGGVVQLYVDNEVIRFEINRRAARRNLLTISSRLLALARLTPDAAGRATETGP